ncbi:MAG: hemin-degrading factor [Verrucomicrobia bacterium]|nr:hemin-degrading factor [Verrucomicrobiota bacterium]
MTTTAATLREQLETLQRAHKGAHMSDLARSLNLTEGQLIATGCDTGEAVRLDPRWQDFLPRLPELGKVMVLTRNHAMVHEKEGAFGGVGLFGSMAQVVNHDVDLRIFLRHWRHAFAVQQPSHGRTLPSLQIFDAAGHPVHKIFLRAHSDHEAYKTLVNDFTLTGEAPAFAAPEPAAPRTAPGEVDREALRARWLDLQDTHDFFPMIKDFGLTRRDANAAAGPDLAETLSPDALEALLDTASKIGVPIMIFVGNPGCIQIHTGPVHRVERMGPWLNVLDPGFNLHARTDLVGEVWRVRKPTRDGIVTSIELFDTKGRELAQLFGERKPGKPELPEWRAMAESLPTLNPEGVVL